MYKIKNLFRNKESNKRLLYLLFILEIIFAGLSILGQCYKWPMRGRRVAFEYLDNFHEFMITCSTMTTAVVILCYSIFDGKRLGISNRTIVGYRIGNETLPTAFFLSLMKLPMFKICIYCEWKYVLLWELPYSLIIQFAIIAFVTWSSSMNATIKTIAKQEEWQYKKMLDYKWDKWETLDSFSLWKIPHIQQAMTSDELFSDKLRLLKAVFEKGQTKEYTYSRMSERNALYSFYYNNAYEAFDAVKDNVDERQKLYTFFYSEVGELIEKSKSTIFDERINYKEGNPKQESIKIGYKLNLAISAIINAAMFSNVKDAEIFSNYLLKEVCSNMDPKLRMRQIVYYFYTLELFYRTNEIKEKAIHIKELCTLIKDEPLECMDMRYYEYWEFITRKCTLDKEFSERVYYDAGLTLKGREQSSVLMLYILQLIKEERKV